MLFVLFALLLFTFVILNNFSHKHEYSLGTETLQLCRINTCCVMNKLYWNKHSLPFTGTQKKSHFPGTKEIQGVRLRRSIIRGATLSEIAQREHILELRAIHGSHWPSYSLTSSSTRTDINSESISFIFT